MTSLRRWFAGRWPLWTIPLALLGICLLTYGLLIARLGLYWDDWPMMYFLHLFGPAGYADIFTVDRPFLSVLYMLSSALIGESVLGWHLFAIATRFLCLMAVWGFLKLLWPRHSRPVIAVLFLYAVYPGFQQQPISTVYGNAWALFSMYYLSLAATILAQRKPRWFWPFTVLALIFSALSLFPAEYYFGLEFLRPLILWIVLSPQEPRLRPRLARTLKHWLPYVALVGVYLYWRVFLFKFPGYQPETLDQLALNPIQQLLTLLGLIPADMFQGGLAAWGNTFLFPDAATFGMRSLALLLGLIALAALAAFVYLARLSPAAQPEESSPRRWAWQALLVGTAALFLGGWPFWIANLPIDLAFPYDRFTLALMLGSCLLVVGLLELLLPNWTAKAAALALLIGLAVGFHFKNATLFRRDWEVQKTLLWQISWRIPALQPDTLLLTDHFPMRYYSDNSLTAPLNWMYGPAEPSHHLPYLLYYLDIRLGLPSLPNLAHGQPITREYRTMTFSGSTAQALVLYYTPPACLKIVDPQLDALNPELPEGVRQAIHLSDLETILPDAARQPDVPTHILGSEPRHDWCYYYETADLARQKGDWPQVAELGDRAFALNEYPNGVTERLVFAEGYAHVGRWEDAARLGEETYRLTPSLGPMLCALWERIDLGTPASAEKAAALESARTLLACPASGGQP